MNNTLTALNNALFAEIERIQDDEMTDAQLDAAIKRSAAVTKVAETIVRNGELALKTMQHLNEMGYGQHAVDQRELAPVPAMLAEK